MKIPFFSRLSRRQLEEEIRRLRRELYGLKQKKPEAAGSPHEPLRLIARALRDASTLETFSDAAIGIAIAALGAERGALILERGRDLAVVAARDATQAIPAASFAWSRGIAAAAILEGEVVATGRAADDERFRSRTSVVQHELESVLALPLPAGKTRGCLYLEAPPSGFAALEAATLLAIVDLIAVALGRLEGEAEATRREKLRAIGLAAAAIIHDLRSPLTTIQFALESLRGARPEDERTRAIGLLACGRARDLSAGIVGLATGRSAELRPASERLAPLVEQHLQLIEPQLAAVGIKIERAPDPDATAWVDRSALLRILDNLTRNAERALDEGGTISLGCSPPEAGSVRLTVADDGPGMEPALVAQMLQVPSDVDAGGARGLGLMLVKELLVAMGGSLEATSAPGRGTRFTITLPVAPSSGESGSRSAGRG